ncbi:glycine--tRNA ligase subunit beta [Paenibacillus sp. HN-1]|uniref:glycine--tRNA ligase subunit beta n=1 Tax=Paenibacillus TaxID=44249 RepID=UPI001CA89395|nr:MULTISPECIES: glycine--tRNA ligase subunit beta [Paenibacillus]MBY9076921.1 glycine--tRNA ligase subunit beta [Paenibacillus sp. CGMCC 1.18879]MBY9086186.1 glycine--tRNA ligase subunit beta [Paenibacillus sinensis]
MAKDLLFEIGLEEIPARFIRAAMEQLKERTEKWLESSRIEHGEVQAFATPRRLAVLVKDASERQADVSEEVKGPSRKIALGEDGAWSKAALGFARSQGVSPDDFIFKELGGVEYIYATKNSKGVESASLLAEGLTGIVHAMTFPKNMRWGAYDFKFVRPIRWLVALFGSAVIDFEIAGVKTGNVSRGHRFLGQETVIQQPSQYVEALRGQYVLADVKERESLILEQINRLAGEKDWTIAIKEDLLEEVLFLVETPTVLFGTFDPSFLNIPQEVLITSMREHQRYFPVLDKDGKLLPYFVTVRNGNAEHLETIAKGNEKVLRARLSDAKFFYEEDQKLKIEDALAKLENIVYHEELGSVADKVRRIRQIADALAAKLGAAERAKVSRAADICKFDLVTQMVYEFPELQGTMGEDYARLAGEDEQVAKAVFEHYQPRFAGDVIPSTEAGSIVSIADKIDTIVGCFSIGIIPTGSQDPYALRRQTAGIVQIVLERKLPIGLNDIFDIAIQVHEISRNLKLSEGDLRITLYEFFGLRVKRLLEGSVRYDVIDAVMAAGYNNVVSVVSRSQALADTVASQENFKNTVDSFTRVGNLASKAGEAALDPALFSEAAESALYDAWQSIHLPYVKALDSGDMTLALSLLSGMSNAITVFFDSVMVMAEDEVVRGNRLALLAGIDGDMKSFADFGKLVW